MSQIEGLLMFEQPVDLLAMAVQEATMSEQFEPVIIGFTCNWCSYRAADMPARRGSNIRQCGWYG